MLHLQKLESFEVVMLQLNKWLVRCDIVTQIGNVTKKEIYLKKVLEPSELLLMEEVNFQVSGCWVKHFKRQQGSVK